MSDRENKDKNKNKKRDFWVSLLLFLSFVFILLSMIGLFGSGLKDVFLGVFGFSGYAIISAVLLLFILRTIGVMRGKLRARTLAFVLGLTLIFLVYLQIVTSHAEYSDIYSPTFSAYLSSCYKAGISTSGGWLFGLAAYPLLAMMGKYSAILVAVLFFLVLFFALLPMMRGAKEQGGSRASTHRAEQASPVRRPSEATERDSGRRLFVDRVRPGQKYAQKIRMKGFFAKKGGEPQFFDYSDDRPLTLSEGVVPEPQATQFDVYGWRRGTVAEDDFYEEHPYSSRGESMRSSDEDLTSPESDMPPYFRRLAGERARANRTLYGDDTLSTIPDEPIFERREEPEVSTTQETTPVNAIPVEPIQQAPIPRVQDHVVRTRPQTDGIIENMSDLQRIRQRESASMPKRASFIGEDIKPVERVESSPSQDISAESFLPEEPSVSSTNPEPSVRIENRAVDERTITPSDASPLRPVERVPERPIIADPTPAVENEPMLSDAFAEPSLTPQPTRKPRSDIGGTHHTRAPEEPRFERKKEKVEQMNIDEIVEEPEPPARPYTPPPVHLLKEYPSVVNDEDVEERGNMLVNALHSFHIDTEVLDHKTGPTFTQFAVKLPDNMSVNKLTPLEKDIKRKLMVEKNIRIIPSVPGLDAVGIEVPNEKTSMVGLRSIINSPDFTKEGKLYFAIGVNVSGQPVYGDILKMPHLLIAGSTGSGKSVAINVLITSIMYHYSPDVVRFIMVDPKKVELSVYKDMPHMLMTSTVTEADKAVNALTWAVNEMERRYQLLMENNCRNLGEYNAMMKKQGKKGLYYILFIVDEMADLMSVAKREVEEKISRISAKARAAGIHLIIATQRPSVDVITGLIKNNIPTRIAFKVTSFTDSKTILDRGGAECLFGNGDMLYVPPEGGDPIRLQGPYINEEISSIVSFVKNNNDARFDNDAERLIQAEKETPEVKEGADTEEDDGEDPLFSQALLYFINNGQASISKLQMKYRIGYGRAARIVETMSERGYLGPAEGGNKSRQVIITLDEYYQLYGEDGGEE